MTDSTIECPVCGSTRTAVWYEPELTDVREVSFSYTFRPEHTRTFAVRRCSECSHAFCAPIPSDIYRHYVDVVDEEYLRHAESRRLAAEAVIRSIRRRGGAGRLLDVGCATGDFLLAARDAGFDVEGLELSSWSSAIAKERRLDVHQMTLAELAQQRPGSFDVITLIGVIEHFAAPRMEARHLRALLRDGGMLVIWTGDVDSVTSRVLKRRWWYWQGQHIQYFTKRSLKRLCGDAGIEPVAMETYPFAADFSTTANSLRRYRLHRLLTWLSRPFFRLRRIWYLRIPGEMLLFAKRR